MKTNDKFTLDGHTPVPCEDLITWAKWMEKHKRRVAKTVVGEVRISTVFLGLNHSFDEDEPPILFETMIFGGANDQAQWRCKTWDEAETGHRMAVALVKEHG